MGAGAGLEDGVFKTGAGPDPDVGTSAPFLCHEIVNREALSISQKPSSGKSSHSGTFSTHLLALQGLQTLSVKVWIVDILGFVGYTPSLAAAAFLRLFLLFHFFVTLYKCENYY